MQTTVSTRGQIVLPGALRRKLGIQTGDAMDVSVQAGQIVLSPRRKKLPKSRIITDPVTGLAVLSVGKAATPLRSRDVDEILSQFP